MPRGRSRIVFLHGMCDKLKMLVTPSPLSYGFAIKLFLHTHNIQMCVISCENHGARSCSGMYYWSIVKRCVYVCVCGNFASIGLYQNLVCILHIEHSINHYNQKWNNHGISCFSHHGKGEKERLA